MSKQQLENKYQIRIEKNDGVYFVFNTKTNILLFLAPDLATIDKSMQYLGKSEF